MPFVTPNLTDLEAFEQARIARRDAVYARILDPRYAAHFQPADIHDAIYSYIRQQGKGLRPMLMMLCAGAVGGDERKAIPAAAAIEIFHTWTLVHDDIIDRDALRRGSPTVHTEFTTRSRTELGYNADEAAHYGATVAILAGDVQQGWSYSLLAELAEEGVSPIVALYLIKYLSQTVETALVDGEMRDVQYSNLPIEQLSEADILEMLAKKTAVLYQFAARAGAVIGLDDSTAQLETVAALERFAGDCGLAFQLQDDILGLTADERILGKSVGSDIRAGKRTLIVYHALREAGTQERALLLQTLGNPAASPTQVAKATQYLVDCGAVAKAQSLARRYSEDASAALNALPDSDYKRLLNTWGWYVVGRTML
jgi:geranylgeranyl diphosphate synthase, type I